MKEAAKDPIWWHEKPVKGGVQVTVRLEASEFVRRMSDVDRVVAEMIRKSGGGQ